MGGKLRVERFVFLIIAFVGVVLLFHTFISKLMLDVFFVDYLTASCSSGVILLTLLYLFAKFNKSLENQISNFLYFKGTAPYKILLKEAVTDGLTGLYDHRYLMMSLEDEIERSRRYKRPISFLMIDIDNFKKYNDTFGHPSGDELLAQVAGLFKRLARKVDTVARYGGEEFAIILPETIKEGAWVAAERLRNRVAEMEFAENSKISVSIGIGFFDGVDNSFTKEDLVDMADKALYNAKTGGRNKVEG